MSLLIGDDYPEAVEPHGRENPVPAQGLRDGPAPGGKRRGWARWPGRRPRSMLIQDAPDPAGDGPEYGAEEIDDGGPPYPGNGFFLDPGLGTDGYPQDGYPPTVIPRTVIPGTDPLSSGPLSGRPYCRGSLSRGPYYQRPLSTIWLRRFP